MSVRSKSTISSYARLHCSSVANPSTRSTSTRPYHDRSNTDMPPQPGMDGQKRQRKWWRFSSKVGAANCVTRTWRGSSGATSRLIAPPLPDASQPSNTMQSGGPELAAAQLTAEGEAQLEQPLLCRLEPLGLLVRGDPQGQIELGQPSHARQRATSTSPSDGQRGSQAGLEVGGANR